MPRFPAARVLSLLVLLAFLPARAATAPARKPSAKPRRPPLDLVWHVETLDGTVLDSKMADSPINPASVVKVATSMWALEKLGPGYRFETRVFTRGAIDRSKGTLAGALVFEGDGDPDFHCENAFLIAAALNEMGIQRVTGGLVVGTKFWMGWEGGSEGTNPDGHTRGILMATRLRKALDPRRWDRATWSAWRSFAARRSLDAAHPPRVAILGGLQVEAAPSGGELALVHRSNLLESTLRRFNCYSNNDIERVGSALGTAGDLATVLASRWGSDGAQVQLATTSGLGENRLTPRLVVRLLRDFRNAAELNGKRIEELLPVAGCDPGTVASFFPRLTSDANATALVGKTGTLTSTDGGVSVLAGFVNTTQGEVVFCVAAPRAIGRIRSARRAEESWVLDLLAKQGGPRPRFCAPPLADSDTGAIVLTTELPAEPTR
jgi:D-alanyl-D-alanine carboxypeptidase/D-alanyl-D-alanine-endopeptidase (penicillin-binding protein 4)